MGIRDVGNRSGHRLVLPYHMDTKMTKKEAYASVKIGDKIMVNIGAGPQEMEVSEKQNDTLRVVGQVTHPDHGKLMTAEFIYDTVFGPEEWKIVKYRRGGKKPK